MKLLLILVALMMTVAFTACGRSEPAPEEVPAITDEETYTEEDEPYDENNEYDTLDEEPEMEVIELFPAPDDDAFEAAMEILIGAYVGLVEVIVEVVDELFELETEEELHEWVEGLEILREYVGLTIDLLLDIEDIVPDVQADYFIMYNEAMYLIYEGLAEFASSIEAAIQDGEEAKFAAIDAFELNLLAAESLIWGE